jgi:hypothetical protein
MADPSWPIPPPVRRRNVPGASPFSPRNDVGVPIMGKALILWMLGVPGVIVILLLVTHVL